MPNNNKIRFLSVDPPPFPRRATALIADARTAELKQYDAAEILFVLFLRCTVPTILLVAHGTRFIRGPRVAYRAGSAPLL